MTYIILLVYVPVTIHILLQYNSLLIHMTIVIKYHNVIVIVLFIGYHIFVLYFLSVTMKQ